jgi:nitrogen-specific signal transduction histidine kinase/CheY-like chemotaxis protein
VPQDDTHVPIDIRFRRRSGEVFPTKTVTAEIKEPSGRCMGFVCIIRDITREVEREDALRKAQRMEAYGQLTGGVAHDFNNLLTIIMGNQELLEMRLRDERERALLKRAQDAAAMGARLTNRLLTFARRRQLEPIIVHLNEQISGLAELLRRTLGEPIRLTCRLAPDLRTVRADPSEIENAVLNLAINARDAMAIGGELIVETANTSFEAGDEIVSGGVPAGDYVRLSVSDTGAGMAPEVLSRAFEPFFTTKEPGRGTGLGLSTVYGFVKQSGGHITIYSEPGRGTTVNLYLPCADGKVASDGPSIRRVVAPAPRTETILVVEDNPEVRDVSVARLKSLGFGVLEAHSGPSAIEILNAGARVDLVFSDIVMSGGMSGFDLARWLSKSMPAMKMLLTSGFSPEVARSDKAAVPTLRILRKPYTRAELEEAIIETLAG